MRKKHEKDHFACFLMFLPSRPFLERVTGYKSMSLLDLQNHEKEMKTEVELRELESWNEESRVM